MVSGSLVEILVCVVIVGGIFWMIWRGGAANPEGTASVIRRMTAHENRLAGVEDKISNTATKAELGLLAGEMHRMEAAAASSAEVVDLAMKVERLTRGLESTASSADIAALKEQVAAITKAADRTEAGVQRIEGYFLQRGIDR